MKLLAIFLMGLFISNGILSQSVFDFSGYSPGQTFTTNSYSFTKLVNGTTMTARVTQTANPTWFNLTGPVGASGMSPNNATYAPGTCSSFTGLFLASNRTSTTPVVRLELSFSPAVCGPVNFDIADINGANSSFRDDVTISAFDQDNVAIPLTTAMVNNNGTGNCNGGDYGTYTHTTGNSLKIVGCSYDDCARDYFTIHSSTKMISRITIDYASGNRDWNGNTISNPDLQYIIISSIRAYTPVINISQSCGVNPVTLTASVAAPTIFPPTTSPWGVLSTNYPALPAGSRPTAPTYSWTGTAGTINSPTNLVTTVSGLTSAGGTFTITGQNNRGCVATKSLTLTPVNCVVLPIELTEFGGKCAKNGSIDLFWTTKSESNNSHFIVEQSSDGIHYVQAMKVNGAGNSSTEMNYSTSLKLRKGQYFRLRQVDFDDQSAVSDAIFVPCEEDATQVSFYPNPAGDFITVSGQILKNTSETYLEVFSLDGKWIKRIDISNQHESEFSFSISDLESGLYIFKLISDLEVYTSEKIVKL